jgi:hypothetical protein
VKEGLSSKARACHCEECRRHDEAICSPAGDCFAACARMTSTPLS